VSTQCKFDFLETKDVEVRFDEGPISSDAGLSVIIQWMNQTDSLDRYVEILEETDDRDPERIDHSMKQLLRQRILQVMAGYEDANDCDRLADAPLFQAANRRLNEDKTTNASQPTMSRLENQVDSRDVVRLNHELLEAYIDAHRENVPGEILLDIDATPAATHGGQQRALFDRHRGQRMYFPLMLCDGETGELLAVRLRSGRASDKHRAKPMIRRVVSRLREAFGDVSIRFRADAGFTEARLFRLLDELGVKWRINYAANSLLKDRTDDCLEAAQTKYDQTSQKVTRYKLLADYQAKTWEQSRWVAAKVECGPNGTNRRFVVCSDRPVSAKQAFGFYEARGVCEQYIKEFKGGYRADKLSCHRFVANAFRLVLYGMAYTLIARFRHQHLTNTDLEGAWIQTIRTKLFKLGARIEVTVRRFWIHDSREWPYRDLFKQVAASVCPQPG
jgi:hypothetical protein